MSDNGNGKALKPNEGKVLNFIEDIGNRLWDPVTIYLVLCIIVFVASAILAKLDFQAVHPGTGETLKVVNLLKKANLQQFLGDITANFQGFPPLSLALVVIMGVGVADRTGLMSALIRQSIMKVPDNLITAMIVFIGINAVAAGDAGFIVLPPLAATIYLGIGRHPLAGFYTAYGSVAAGFAASLMVQMGDVICASFTIPAAQLIDPSYQSTAAMNYYFMIASTFLMLILGVYINNKIIEPRLGEYKGDVRDIDVDTNLTAAESKGLKHAAIWTGILALILVALSLGDNAFLADPETNSLISPDSPLMKGLIPIVTVIFLVPGVVYGKVTGAIKRDRDIVRMMAESVGEMGGYIVIALIASQFLAIFDQSNLGAIIAIKGAEALQNVGFTGIGAAIALILLTAFINMFLGSQGAKWGIMAPIFIPMFMLLGYDPAFTQICYRIGDSITNPLTPLFSYFPIILGLARKYDKDIGMGSIIANMLPFSVIFCIGWIILLIIFIVFDLPLGPGGAGIFL